MMLGNGDGTLGYAEAFAAGATPSAVAVGHFSDSRSGTGNRPHAECS
jgi:hypothetical protein